LRLKSNTLQITGTYLNMNHLCKD